MAKMIESVIVIKASKLVTDSSPETEVLSADTVAALNDVVKELAGDNALIEIETYGDSEE